jgi:hypothetical protein
MSMWEIYIFMDEIVEIEVAEQGNFFCLTKLLDPCLMM